ncbi:acyl-CoA dehydrogenase family protein [Tardiphaga sp. 42S5]|uniref:acyl-CoA dehydrogenase family protein n=1 Tax=Tardiphaga sp. 42S5 TaxID=1404799 RepID=UPI002A5A8050|nr:acyl-CoA dehydrogenase family protein [Tardiphaga sp. 42S5]WPO41675.1 acyl-CoA dehydrogenase family protein [Tardiphaga sp. 42S5]
MIPNAVKQGIDVPEAVSWRDAMRRVAIEVASPNAALADLTATFPAQTFEALRRNEMLGLMVPRSLGGQELELRKIANLCAILAGACGASGMIYAMHQIKLSSLVAHGMQTEYHRALMRDVAVKQLLIASSTTEAGIGGDLRISNCAIETTGDRVSLTKQASVLSYAAEADIIMATARRGPASIGSDQVLIALRRGDYQLQRTAEWNTLGMRATCSEGFLLTATAGVDQIFPKPFHEIAVQSMLATAHVLWASVWFGIATDALSRAHASVRATARRVPSDFAGPLPGAARLTEATAKLQTFKSTLVAHINRFETAKRNEDDLSSINLAIEMNNLKVMASTMAVDIVREALMVTGIAGYRNDGPFSVGRHLRDVLSAPLMVANDRILANTAGLVVASRFDSDLE